MIAIRDFTKIDGYNCTRCTRFNREPEYLGKFSSNNIFQKKCNIWRILDNIHLLVTRFRTNSFDVSISFLLCFQTILCCSFFGVWFAHIVFPLLFIFSQLSSISSFHNFRPFFKSIEGQRYCISIDFTYHFVYVLSTELSRTLCGFLGV